MSDQMGASVEVVRLSSYYGGYYWDIVWDGEQGCGGKKRGGGREKEETPEDVKDISWRGER